MRFQTCSTRRGNRLPTTPSANTANSIGDDPSLIGFRLHDSPTWDVLKTRGLRGTDWVSEIAPSRFRPCPPGKRRYVEFLKERHGNDLAKATGYYGIQADSWEALPALPFTGVQIWANRR